MSFTAISEDSLMDSSGVRLLRLLSGPMPACSRNFLVPSESPLTPLMKGSVLMNSSVEMFP